MNLRENNILLLGVCVCIGQYKKERNTYTVMKKNIYKKIITIILCFILISSNGIVPVNAADSNAAARKAYKNFLEQSYVEWGAGYLMQMDGARFALAYVDNDNIPELVVKSSGYSNGWDKFSNSQASLPSVAGQAQLYTYKNGQVVELTNLYQGFWYYPRKGVYVDEICHMGYQVRIAKMDTNFLNYSRDQYEIEMATSFSYEKYNGWEYQEISQQAFKNELEKAVGKTKAIEPDYYDNTSANRNKILNAKTITKPTAKLSRVNITQTKLTWNKVKKASGYLIYRSNSKNGTFNKLAELSSKKLSYIDKTCKSGKPYYYKVIAYNALGNQTLSSVQFIKIPSIKTDYSISTPTISSVEKNGKNIIVKWEKITKGGGYVIYRSTDNKKFAVYKVIRGLATTQFTDKNIKSGQKYYYRIATYNGKSTKQSPISSIYVINTKKLQDSSFKTTLLSVKKKTNDKGTVTLKWKKLSNASGYVIYRKEGNGKYKSLFTISNPSKASINDVNLRSGETYTYCIKPFKLVDSNGVKIKYFGSVSNKISIKE